MFPSATEHDSQRRCAKTGESRSSGHHRLTADIEREDIRPLVRFCDRAHCPNHKPDVDKNAKTLEDQKRHTRMLPSAYSSTLTRLTCASMVPSVSEFVRMKRYSRVSVSVGRSTAVGSCRSAYRQRSLDVLSLRERERGKENDKNRRRAKIESVDIPLALRMLSRNDQNMLNERRSLIERVHACRNEKCASSEGESCTRMSNHRRFER